MNTYETDHAAYKACRRLELAFNKKLGKQLNKLFEGLLEGTTITACDGFISFEEQGTRGAFYSFKFVWSTDMEVIEDLTFLPQYSYYKELPDFIKDNKQNMLAIINKERTDYRNKVRPFMKR